MMRKWILAVAALIAVVGPGTGAVWLDSQPSQAAETIVKVDNDKYDPPELTVPPGTSITWLNTDPGGVHTAKAKDGSFDTGYIDPGASSEPIAFSKPGDFRYYCELHPYKLGVVRVK